MTETLIMILSDMEKVAISVIQEDNADCGRFHKNKKQFPHKLFLDAQKS